MSDVLNRVAKHGGGVQNETPSPDAPWVQGGFVFIRLASGHVVNDLVATVPFRIARFLVKLSLVFI